MNKQNLPAATQSDILVYQGDAGVKMTVKTDGETVWLTQEQMCQLFGRDQSVIARHIGNIFKEKELVKDSVCAKFAHTTLHGAIPGKTQTKEVRYCNLDVVISVGYRVKSADHPRTFCRMFWSRPYAPPI